MRRNVFGASAWTSLLCQGLLAKTRDKFDGLVRRRMVPHHPTGELLVETTQPGRELILERNLRHRNEPGSLVDGPLGVHALTIPVQDLRELEARNPELRSPDPETRNRAWRKYIASPESLPYRVRERL